MNLFNLYLKRLRAKVPPDLPVKIRFVEGLERIAGDTAFTSKTDTHYLIEFDKKLGDDMAALLLVHEWPHTLAKPWDAREHHTNAWGAKHAKCWRVAVEDKAR